MEQYRERIEKELNQGILGYWSKTAIDVCNGGFYGNITNDNFIEKDSDKGLIQNARNLWSFAKAYNFYKDDKYLEIALMTKNYLLENFKDPINGGFFWTIDSKQRPVNRRKQVYGHAFVIYAFSELYFATNDEKDLQIAKETYFLLEKYAFDKKHNGYFEAFSENWSSIDDIRLSPMDMNEKKSNNTHLHILEAYTNLLKAWPSEGLKKQLKNIVEVMLFKIMDTKTLNFGLFFDEFWTKKSDVISYGHEIEGAWLIYDALETIGDNFFTKDNTKYIIGITENCYQNYLDGKSGEMGMFNETDSTGNIDKDKIWWVQAEACVGFYLAYQLTHDDKFLEAVKNIWEFIEDYIVDKENGEWFWYGTDPGTKSNIKYKVMNWKSLYHNSRACFELLRRSN